MPTKCEADPAAERSLHGRIHVKKARTAQSRRHLLQQLDPSAVPNLVESIACCLLCVIPLLARRLLCVAEPISHILSIHSFFDLPKRVPAYICNNTCFLLLVPGNGGKHMPPPEPELNPHAQCPVCRFPPVFGGRAGDYLPPPDLHSQWKGFPLSQYSLTLSGKAFPSVLAHELVCQLPSPCSVRVLHEKRAQINGPHMSLACG